MPLMVKEQSVNLMKVAMKNPNSDLTPEQVVDMFIEKGGIPASERDWFIDRLKE